MRRPNRSAIQPARDVLKVAPRLAASPKDPIAMLRNPVRRVRSAAISGIDGREGGGGEHGYELPWHSTAGIQR
jgi:hypothetical protein